MRRQLAWGLPIAASLALVCAALVTQLRAKRVARAHPAAVAAPAGPKRVAAKTDPVPLEDASPRVAAPLVTTELDWIAIGGGYTPQSNEVSLEQDLALAEQVWSGPHVLMFAGGSDARSVRVVDDRAVGDPLLLRLGELFQPHSEHRSRFRRPSLHAAAASLDRVEAQLTAAFSRGEKPLLVYIAAHGQQGEHADENSVALWGGQGLSVARLAELHAAHPRPLRLVSASCFSGGFAELAFEGADPARGSSHAARCGLFAGTWDRETSGCDPNPDRRQQEGYSLHFLQALRGRDRDGTVLPRAELDLDGDGSISLLEAHARASIAGRSIDVPTTTSERQLRATRMRALAPDFRVLPEAAAVVHGLEARLDVHGVKAARQRLSQAAAQLQSLSERVDEADAAAQSSFDELSARLLERWPELDDAYNPAFASLLAHEHAAIERALDSWPEAQRFTAAEGALDALELEYREAEVNEAALARLARSYETLGLATGLRARGGAAWARYQQLLACERYVPPRPEGDGEARAR